MLGMNTAPNKYVLFHRLCENKRCSGERAAHCPVVTLHGEGWMWLEGGPLGKKKKPLSPS